MNGLFLGIGLLLLLQLTLQIVALVLLVKTPSDRITIGGRKWVWALIIILGELVGPILFFILGRKPAPAIEPSVAAPAASRAAEAADALYGAPRHRRAAVAVPPAPAFQSPP